MKAQIGQQMAPEGVQTVLIKLFKKELEEVPSELKIDKCQIGQEIVQVVLIRRILQKLYKDFKEMYGKHFGEIQKEKRLADEYDR